MLITVILQLGKLAYSGQYNIFNCFLFFFFIFYVQGKPKLLELLRNHVVASAQVCAALHKA